MLRLVLSPSGQRTKDKLLSLLACHVLFIQDHTHFEITLSSEVLMTLPQAEGKGKNHKSDSKGGDREGALLSSMRWTTRNILSLSKGTYSINCRKPRLCAGLAEGRETPQGRETPKHRLPFPCLLCGEWLSMETAPGFRNGPPDLHKFIPARVWQGCFLDCSTPVFEV